MRGADGEGGRTSAVGGGLPAATTYAARADRGVEGLPRVRSVRTRVADGVRRGTRRGRHHVDR